MGYWFYSDCVGWPEGDIDSLHHLIDNNLEITRETFLKHINKKDLWITEEQLGYESHWKRGMTMAADWHVSYHRAKLHGETCYYFKWSGIEHVFIKIK